MKHILLVDDSLTNLKLASELLKDYYKVSVTKSGKQALEFCEKHRPDLILLDILMPEMDGFETITHLKKNNQTASIPVIFLTANRDIETEVKGFEYGGVDFITKPFEQSCMLHRIKTHLKLSSYQQHLETEISELQDSMLTVFSELIECRDSETGGHVERTREYVRLLSKELQENGYMGKDLDEEYIETLVRCAPLHDIGKIGISDTILLKPGKLTDEEFEKMKQHTVIGGDVLNKIIEGMPTQHYLDIAKEIAVSHHERFDGRGYPYGLKGDEIPLSARIMSVADVYDALISNRVYRKALSHEEACEIIMEGKNTQFDPHIVDALMRVQHEIEEIAKKKEN